MNLGKALRLRRIFATGQALIVDCAPLCDDPPARVRALARAGVDAVVLTPGLVDVVVEELGALAVILRIDAGNQRMQPLVSVQTALVLGADAVLLTAPHAEALERFGQLTDEARRLGMPVVAEILSENWLDAARLAADCGADVIQVRFVPDRESRHFQRMTGRAFLTMVKHAAPAGLLEAIYDTMQGTAQGVVLCSRELIEQPMLAAIHALVHQGVSADEALRIAGCRPAAAVESE